MLLLHRVDVEVSLFTLSNTVLRLRLFVDEINNNGPHTSKHQ